MKNIKISIEAHDLLRGASIHLRKNLSPLADKYVSEGAIRDMKKKRPLEKPTPSPAKP